MSVFWENQMDPLISFEPRYPHQINRDQGHDNINFEKLDVIKFMGHVNNGKLQLVIK